jgi:hypothetical protein
MSASQCADKPQVTQQRASHILGLRRDQVEEAYGRPVLIDTVERALTWPGSEDTKAKWDKFHERTAFTMLHMPGGAIVELNARGIAIGVSFPDAGMRIPPGRVVPRAGPEPPARAVERVQGQNRQRE